MTDLFQLLGQQQKSGILNLRDANRAIQIFFDNGRVVGIAFPGETSDSSPLGKRLVRGGLLTADLWKKAFDQHREELVSIESVLRKNHWVRDEDLASVQRLLLSETLYGLFKWTGGTFRFESREVAHDSKQMEPINTEFLLLDILRMVDEWPLLADRIPTQKMVLRKVNEISTLDMLAGTPWAERRSFQMEVIYELINGQRSIGEIIDQSFVGEFETSKNIITLMDAGVIEPVGINKVVEPCQGNPFKKKVSPVGGFALIGVLAFLLIFQLVILRGRTFPFSSREYQGWMVLQEVREKIEEGGRAQTKGLLSLETKPPASRSAEPRESGFPSGDPLPRVAARK